MFSIVCIQNTTIQRGYSYSKWCCRYIVVIFDSSCVFWTCFTLNSLLAVLCYVFMLQIFSFSLKWCFLSLFLPYTMQIYASNSMSYWIWYIILIWNSVLFSAQFYGNQNLFQFCLLYSCIWLFYMIHRALWIFIETVILLLFFHFCLVKISYLNPFIVGIECKLFVVII